MGCCDIKLPKSLSLAKGSARAMVCRVYIKCGRSTKSWCKFMVKNIYIKEHLLHYLESHFLEILFICSKKYWALYYIIQIDSASILIVNPLRLTDYIQDL